MNAIPQRIVSLVPSTTGSVVAFGAGARLVGCTRYCSEPAAALRCVARVGGTKNPDREAVLALAPELVLMNREENRVEDLEWLAARVPVLAQTPVTIEEASAALVELAAALGAPDAATPVVARIAATRRQAHDATRGRPRRRVYYAIWPKPWMTVGPGTFVHDVLAAVGLDNVAAVDGPSARYPELSPEQARADGVDVVLLASEPWAFDAAQRDALCASGRFGAAQLVLCDGRDFSWHGAHLAVGLERALRCAQTLAGADQ
ncbi:MAG: ABC transporter substrate-binding protein [Planctomycetes bacterium]|nr:ABC transporter substrate-binding protein [Planctomycetota bacterium]